MEAYQQRVVDEKRDLDAKLTKLMEFMGPSGTGPIFCNLDAAERSRLIEQRQAMQTYSRILGERIAAFK